MPSAKESPVLPLFSKTRRPSATASLQGNLDHDSILSLSNDRPTLTWRQSMGGFAHTVLVKAKNSIDTMRGASSTNDPHDEEAVLLINEEARDVPRGGSLRHHVKERMAEPHKLHRATSSLRRVMTNSSKRATRGSLFETLPPRDSPTAEPPTGPDAVTPEDKSSSANSLKRLSLGTIRKMATPTSKRSSKQSSPLAQADRDIDQPSTPTPRRSSPIPIPQTSSPAPAIQFEIESGSLSPRTLFGFTDQDSSQDGSGFKNAPVHTGGSLKRPLSRIMNRKRPKSASKDRSKECESEDLPAIHVPRRASNDHWRMRNASRKKSQHTDDLPMPTSHDAGPPSPMPGTNLPLDDLFDPTSSAGKAGTSLDGLLPPQRKTASIPSIDGVMEDSAVDGTTLCDSNEKLCPAQDKNDLTQHSEELAASITRDQPEIIANPLSQAELELKQDLEHIKIMLIQVREASVPTPGEQALAGHKDKSLAYESLSQSQALADRLRSIETYVEKISSDIANFTTLSDVERSELELQVESYEHLSESSEPEAECFEPRAESCDLQMGSPEPSIAYGCYQSPILLPSSTRESSESYHSPLITQALFYPSPPNEEDRNSEHGSALSAADQYLQSIRGIATNGRSEAEDIASATVKDITGPVLETLEEARGESPLDEHLRSKPLPKPIRKRFADRHRSSSFDLLDHWRKMTEGEDENDQTTPDEHVTETSSTQSGRQSANRQDSSCFIPVCSVCGGTDDHTCFPAADSLAEAQHDGIVSLPNTKRFIDSDPALLGGGLFPKGATMSDSARQVWDFPESPQVRTQGAVTDFRQWARSPMTVSRRKCRAASPKVPDPFSPNQEISLLWSSENYFAPLTRCKARDDVIRSTSTATKSRKISCNSPSKKSPVVPKVRSMENRKSQYTSFCSDTDLDSDVDDTEFLKVGGALSTFHPTL